jgi:hypothetical protein
MEVKEVSSGSEYGRYRFIDILTVDTTSLFSMRAPSRSLIADLARSIRATYRSDIELQAQVLLLR